MFAHTYCTPSQTTMILTDKDMLAFCDGIRVTYSTDARNVSHFVSLKLDNDINNLFCWRNEECESDNNSILVIGYLFLSLPFTS